MKRGTFWETILALLMLSGSMVTAGFQPVGSEPDTWTVDDDGPADFPTIGEAIDAATSGDTILVREGVYYERVRIDKSLKITGEARENTIIDGNRTGTVVEVTANNAALSGFTVQNSGSQAGTSYAGIRVSGDHVNVTGNIVARNKIGVLVDISSWSRIAENIVKGNGQGISLSYSSEVRVEANNITASTVGISLARSFNNTIAGNVATKSSQGGHGITVLSNSYNNTIIGNDLVNNYHGMWLSGSTDNLIVENTIAHNVLLGIELTDAPDNTAYHNNFINNTKHVVINKPNTWDNGYPSGGNYWSNYTGVDLYRGPYQNETGNDGIGDTPYDVGSGNQDRYPLMNPLGLWAPTVDFTHSPEQPFVGENVTFDASASNDPDGTITSYEWDFDDGNVATVTSPTVTHTYEASDTYNVTLAVADNDGLIRKITRSVTVNARNGATDGDLDGDSQPDGNGTGDTDTDAGQPFPPYGFIAVVGFGAIIFLVLGIVVIGRLLGWSKPAKKRPRRRKR